MALRIKKDNIVWWPVTVKVPQDGGKPEDVEISVKYKLITRSERNEFIGLAFNDDVANADHDVDRALALYRDKVLDWKGIENEDGNELPFSPENLEAMLDHTFFEMALSRGLFQASSGAAAKNS